MEVQSDYYRMFYVNTRLEIENTGCLVTATNSLTRRLYLSEFLRASEIGLKFVVYILVFIQLKICRPSKVVTMYKICEYSRLNKKP